MPPAAPSLHTLSARVAAFSRSLDSLSRSERVFRASVDSVSRSLHGFAAAHARSDAHLARLVAADTRRARDAADEYDALAARFEDALRPHAASKRRQWARTAAFYAGVLLSVVLMAPLHLLVSVAERVLRRMGYHTRKSAPPRYAARTQTRARRDAPRTGAPRPHASASDRSTLGSESLHSGPESVDPDAGPPRETDGGPPRRDAAGRHPPEHARKGPPGEGDAPLRETRDERPKEEAERAESSAEGYSSTGSARPDWATPFDDAAPEIGAVRFPEPEFWNISDDDIRIDRLKAEEDSLATE